MTTPTHHPEEAVLADYAAGSLRPAFAAVVAAHLEACPHCRMTLRALEALGGEMIGELEAAPLSDASLDRVMAGLDRPLTPAAPAQTTIDRIKFGRELWLAPGMSIRKAKSDIGGDLLYMLRLPAGLQTIPHGHQGTEYTTVIKGAFDDGTGVFTAGDFADVNESVEHIPHVTVEGECLCLIASEKPMRVTTWIGRAVHWVTGV